MVDSVHYLSERQDWETPDAFFRALDDEFHFTLDAAANDQNAKVPRYYTEEDDALKQPWPGVVWCNPPYGRVIGQFIKKGWQEAQKGSTVVMLVPARTDNGWWMGHVMLADEVRLLRGRLRFKGAASSAPFPSAIVVFRPPRCWRWRRWPRFFAIERQGKRLEGRGSLLAHWDRLLRRYLQGGAE